MPEYLGNLILCSWYVWNWNYHVYMFDVDGYNLIENHNSVNETMRWTCDFSKNGILYQCDNDLELMDDKYESVYRYRHWLFNKDKI